MDFEINKREVNEEAEEEENEKSPRKRKRSSRLTTMKMVINDSSFVPVHFDSFACVIVVARFAVFYSQVDCNKRDKHHFYCEDFSLALLALLSFSTRFWRH